MGALEIGAAVNVHSTQAQAHDAVIRVYDDVGNVIETHEPVGDFTELQSVDRRRDVRQVFAH